jgi:hypothetical protein
MSEVPEIVYGRLQATPQQREFLARAHPDADLLSAFAEQSLSPIEREDVLGHLSFCADCREVIALALPPERTTIPLPAEAEDGGVQGDDDCSVAIEYAAPPRNSWFGFARPTFGWAALAAGIALAASLLILHPIQQRQAMLHPPSQPSSAVVANGRRETDAAAAVAPSQSQHSPSKELSTTNTVAAKASSSRGKRPEHALHSGSATLLAENKYPRDSLMADNRAPAIEKAKPALEGSESRNETQADRTQTTMSPVAGEASAATWQVEAGVLRRSYDSGRSWQNVLHADHPLLSFASRGQEIWTGGVTGVLFHSSDAGASWVQVQPADDSETLRSDIIRIDLQSGGDIGGLVSRGVSVSTGTGDVWNSLDGGKTWKKQ